MSIKCSLFYQNIPSLKVTCRFNNCSDRFSKWSIRINLRIYIRITQKMKINRKKSIFKPIDNDNLVWTKQGHVIYSTTAWLKLTFIRLWFRLEIGQLNKWQMLVFRAYSIVFPSQRLKLKISWFHASVLAERQKAHNTWLHKACLDLHLSMNSETWPASFIVLQKECRRVSLATQ